MADAGYISDESDFYGRWSLASVSDPTFDEDAGSSQTRVALERQARRELEPPKTNQYARLVNMQRARNEARETQSSHTQQAVRQTRETVDLPKPTALSREEEAYDFDASSPAAWHPSRESILEFLKRAPVADPATAALGPWLWVHNPTFQRSNESRADVSGFTDVGQGLLQVYQRQRRKFEAELAGKTEATITRKLKPYREELQKNILRAAVDANVTSGKWMLFPKADAVPKTWRQVAEATAGGQLGPTCKVATAADNGKDVSLICVYTYDFTDTADVQRVLEALMEIGLVSQERTPIYYKCDAYTYLNITSGNEYKLKASLYASKDFRSEGPSKSVGKQPASSTNKDSFFATLSL